MIITHKNFLIVLSALVCVFNQNAIAFQSDESGSVSLDGSKLTINGTSNVNDFRCIYDEDSASGTASNEQYDAIQNASTSTSEDVLVLVVDSFDCGKRGINRDFRNTLKSDIYPTIHVELIDVVRKNEIPAMAIVNISLVGITKEYSVELGEAYVEDGDTLVPGTQIINMSDFNIEPPRALFGLIKVRDELTIQFSLRIK